MMCAARVVFPVPDAPKTQSAELVSQFLQFRNFMSSRIHLPVPSVLFSLCLNSSADPSGGEIHASILFLYYNIEKRQH